MPGERRARTRHTPDGPHQAALSQNMSRTSALAGLEGLFQQDQQPGEHLVDDGRADLLDEGGNAAMRVENAWLIAQYDALAVSARARDILCMGFFAYA